MIPQVGGFQGCYLDNHRNNWRCARAVCALCENAPKVRSGVERTMRDHFPLGCNVTVCYRGERKELTPHGPYFGQLC